MILSATAAFERTRAELSGFYPSRGLTVVLAIAGGILSQASFPRLSLWPLAFVGITFLVLAARRESARWNALVGWLWGLALFLPHLYWANVSVGPVPWLALSFAEAAIMSAALIVWTWVRRAAWVRGRTILPGIAFGLVWIVTEQVRHMWPFGGFPWGRLAFSQADGPFLPLAALAGAPAVSFAVASCGYWLAALVLAILVLRRERSQAARATSLAAGGAVLAALAASFVISTPTVAETGTLKVGAVQGNVSEPGLGAFRNAREVLKNHASGTHELAESVGTGTLDVVVWPENSSDINPREDHRAATTIDAAATAIGAPILLGTNSYGVNADGEDVRFNDMVLWEAGEGVRFSYAKQRPAPFAEYIPIRKIARTFSSAVDMVKTDMAPGTEIATVPVPISRLDRTVTIGTVICFEVAYDALIRESVQAGAEILFVPTNNASFGYSAESEQQLAMSRLRAVEHGRSTVQISTVGVSGVIAPDGTLLQSTELFTPATMTAELPLRETLTVADRLGDGPIAVATVLTAGLLLIGLATGRRSRAG